MKKVVMVVRESSYKEIMEELKDLNLEDLGVMIERKSDTEFDLFYVEDKESYE